MSREPCLCGALDCVACRGPSAKYATWCDECPYSDECNETTSPGDSACQLQTDNDDAEVEAHEANMEARADRIRDGWDF